MFIMINAVTMMITETRMVVPNPKIRLFLIDMFLKFICSAS